jgi:outer membrane protein, heavy metal efflux system
MKLLKLFVIAFLLICFSSVKSQVLTIDSIKAIIEKQYPELAMYNLQVKAYDAYAEGAKSWEAPQIGTGLYMTPYNFEKNMGAYMISIQQMIPNPAKQKANQQYMLAMSSVDVQNEKAAANELYALAKEDYAEWIILKKKKTILSESEELLNYIIKVSEIRYPYEQEKLNDIYKAKAALGELQNMQIENDNEIQQKLISLNTLMNRDKTTTFDIDTNYTVQNYETEIVDTTSIFESRSDIKSIDQEIKIAQLKQQVEWSKRLPEFGIKYDNMFAFGTVPNQFSIEGMITIPIVPWSSKMYKSNVAGINYEIAAFKKQKEALVNETSGEIISLQSQIKSKKLQVSLYKDNIIPALEKNYKTTLLAYDQNTEDLFSVLDAWQSLKMGRIEYLEMIKDLLLLQVDFEKQIEK